MLTAKENYFELREIGDVTIVTFVCRRILQDLQIRDIGIRLLELVDTENRTKILIDFGRVEFMSSAMFGKLIALGKKVKIRQGRLVFCGLIKEVYEVFAITRLNRHFEIVGTEEDGLQLF